MFGAAQISLVAEMRVRGAERVYRVVVRSQSVRQQNQTDEWREAKQKRTGQPPRAVPEVLQERHT